MQPHINQLKQIAKIYGVKIKLTNKSRGGFYWDNTIYLSKNMNSKDTLDVFFHELAHYKNDIENKYPLYHHVSSSKLIRIYGIKWFCRYALKAEIYTDKIGKNLCKIWFPKHKYEISYKNDNYNYGFLRGYYL